MKQTKKSNQPEPAMETPAMMDYTKFATTGFENTSTDDLGIPFLQLLQKGSPEVDEQHAEHETYRIEGAKAGSIINTLTRDLLWSPKTDMAPIMFVPCIYQKLFVEWTPRERGGGIVRSHADPNILAECTRNQKNQDVLKNGNMIVTTAYFSGFYLTDGGHYKAMISMTSTQLKKARLWLNMMMSLKVSTPAGRVTPPMFSHKYAITSVPESNEKGNWAGWKIEMGGPIASMDTLQLAADFAKQMHQSQQKLLTAPKTASVSDDDIPV